MSLYDQSGNEFRVTEELSGNRVLAYAQMFDDEGGEVYDGELRIFRDDELRETPPSYVVEAGIAELNAGIAELNATHEGLLAQIRKAREDLKTIDADAAGRIAKLKRHKGLELLEDFLDGGITHYVMVEYGPPTIMEFADCKVRGDDGGWHCHKMRLLSLFGGSDGDLGWELSRYSDGSGIGKLVFPCMSYEAAVGKAAVLFSEHVTKVLDADLKGTRPERSWLDRAAKYGIYLGDVYRELLEAKEAEARRWNIDRLEAEIKALRPPDEATVK